jgi:hypothetical protein
LALALALALAFLRRDRALAGTVSGWAGASVEGVALDPGGVISALIV